MQDWRERFWAKVDKRGADDCWEWKASRLRDGYGRFRTPRTHLMAHRVTWEIVNGPIPDGLDCLHKCDNPPCCNPAHLFLGTNAVNIADRDAKGRQAKGERSGRHTHPERTARGGRNGNAKLTGRQIQDIRVIYASGAQTQLAIARQYAITDSYVSKITNRKTWTWLQ